MVIDCWSENSGEFLKSFNGLLRAGKGIRRDQIHVQDGEYGTTEHWFEKSKREKWKEL